MFFQAGEVAPQALQQCRRDAGDIVLGCIDAYSSTAAQAEVSRRRASMLAQPVQVVTHGAHLRRL